MRYVYEGIANVVIVDGKVYPIYSDGAQKYVDIPDNVKVDIKGLEPVVMKVKEEESKRKSVKKQVGDE